jgi:hypothetical protein
VEGEIDVRAGLRRRLRIGLLAIAGLAAAAVAYTVWHRMHRRSAARDRVLAIAAAYQRCLLGADGVADRDVIGTLYRRAIDHPRSDDISCWTTADTAILDVDADVGIDHLPDDVAAIAGDFSFGSPVSSDPFGACLAIGTLRIQLAAAAGANLSEVDCALEPAGALTYPHGDSLEGDLLVVDDNGTVQRVRADRTIADAREASSDFALDGDELAFVTRDHHLARWRGATRTDGPALPASLGVIRAWRHLADGSLGVFARDGGLRAQRFDDALHPAGDATVVPNAQEFDRVAIGPDGAIAVVPRARGTCVTARTLWTLDGDRVWVGPIGASATSPGTLPAQAKPIASDCDDARLYLAANVGYVVCDHARCTLARALPHVSDAGVRVHDGGAEVLAVLDLQNALALVDLRDPRGDGHADLTPFSAAITSGPVSYGGRWFLVRYP